ncbi:MAG: O-succinylhomoserine sulfhydrylase [Thiohalospira sp.]
MSQDFEPSEWEFDTLAVRAGHRRTGEGEQSEPIFATSSYVYDSAAQAAARFAGDEPGNIYSRFTNPTVRTFEERLAALEGAERGVATSSGMAAILSTCLGLLNAGDHIVASRGLFGSTVALFDKHLSRFGITTTYVSPTDPAEWSAAVRDETRLLFLETPTNPLTEVADIAAIASVARERGVLFAVDNCFCTPVLQRPLDLGADIVIHSATKYIDGQGRAVGGAVVGGEAEMEPVHSFLRTAGPCMSPFNAWIFLKGLETLRVRMEAHCAAAMELARWLVARPEVARVHYPGLEDHPQHALAARQQRAFGGILPFELYGGQPAAWAFIDALELFSVTANLGDAKSTVTHPATTTHSRVSAEDRATAGIGDGLIRISVGLESVEDLKRDIAQGLRAAGGIS